MARSDPAASDFETNTDFGRQPLDHGHWPEPPWRYQALALLVIVLGLVVMTLAAH